MIRTVMNQVLQTPPVIGWGAMLCGSLGIVVPTLVRAAVSGAVGGCEFTPYLPSVSICAILMRWWQAALVALASIATLGLLFDGSPAQFLRSPCFQSSAGMFVASSAAMIGIAVLIRSAIAAAQRREANDTSGGIVFSLERGDVWASWYGNAAPIRLGAQIKVAAMMEDFLKQVEIGKRLTEAS